MKIKKLTIEQIAEIKAIGEKFGELEEEQRALIDSVFETLGINQDHPDEIDTVDALINFYLQSSDWKSHYDVSDSCNMFLDFADGILAKSQQEMIIKEAKRRLKKLVVASKKIEEESKKIADSLGLEAFELDKIKGEYNGDVPDNWIKRQFSS